MNYFNHLKAAIDTHSLVVVVEAVDELRQHKKAVLIKQGKLIRGARHAEAMMAVQSVLESRSEDDITPLMYTCLAHYDNVSNGNSIACLQLNEIARYLIEQKATVLQEGGRPLVRTVDRNTGRPVFVRGQGKTLVEVLGRNRLPPAVRHHIQTVVSSYLPAPVRKPIAWLNPILVPAPEQQIVRQHAS